MYYFGSTYTKIGTIQRRLAWPLRKDDTQNREAFHIFCPHVTKFENYFTFGVTLVDEKSEKSKNIPILIFFK